MRQANAAELSTAAGIGRAPAEQTRWTARMRRAVPPQPVFTRADARACGWSDSALSRAARSGKLLIVRRGVFALAGEPSECAAARAAVARFGDSVISHRSGLLMHGLPIVGRRPAVPEVTVPPRTTGRAVAAHLHRARLWPEDVVVIDGAPVTSVARTVIDIGRSAPIGTSVAAIDAALNNGLTTYSELDAALTRCWNWPGIRRAQRAVRFSDGRAESALESVSRLVIGWLGLPSPDLQPLALDRHLRPAGRLDFYWDEFGVAGEADGRSKYDDRDVLFAEKERQELLEHDRLIFARWGWQTATRQPHVLRARIQDAFERGLALDRSGSRRYWSIVRTQPVTASENLITEPPNRPPGTKT